MDPNQKATSKLTMRASTPISAQYGPWEEPTAATTNTTIAICTIMIPGRNLKIDTASTSLEFRPVRRSDTAILSRTLTYSLNDKHCNDANSTRYIIPQFLTIRLFFLAHTSVLI